LITRYDKYIVEYAKEMADMINNWEYEKEPYVSIFVSDCDKLNEDIIDCRGKYNYCGLTTVSLGNVVNSILNIDKYVFRDNKYTLKEFNELRNNNFNNDNHILNDLKDNSKRYGLDDEEVLNLSNRIMNMMSKSISDNLIKGGKIKIGYSAPSYITHSVNQYASFDGRKNGEPFIVHISSDINGLPYTSLFNFAGQLDYSSNKINGNVIDFIVNPSFLECNYDKFIDFLRISISNNLFYEMQMNVVSSKILIAAKKNPQLYPNLIVRVWGFSAYFNDLPESYKDVLILRAQESEKGYE
jgi:formate C-acetyltransferase